MNLRSTLAGAFLLLTVARAQATENPAAADRTLEFVENKGQWAAPVRYAADLPSGRLFVEADGLRFALTEPVRPHHGPQSAGVATPPPAADAPVHAHALDVRFVGAAATARLTASGITAEHRNYLLGADATHWASDVRGFRQLRYADLWPGIDARLYENADQLLEYDFDLAPGADPAAIGLRHLGADGLALNAAGHLLVKNTVGTLTERAPVAWQFDAAGQRQPVPCRYVLTGDVVRFALGSYDHARPLTIDPTVVFSTYTASFANNWGYTATYDAQGNLYSGGIAFSLGYPTSPGAYQTFFGGIIDIALIKYNTSVSGSAARVWATYIGGNRADFPHSLVVNSQNELLLMGTTASIDYPTTVGALQRNFAGGTPTTLDSQNIPGTDIVISRLNAAGSALAASTYLGGASNDGLLPNPTSTSQLAYNYGDSFRGDILTDASGNVYIASVTSSASFPAAPGFGTAYRGGASDGLVCKLPPTLGSLTWRNYLGGTGDDAAYSLQLEPASGDVYVAGGTTSANFPTTAGSLRPTQPGGTDGFVARIAASGTVLSRATYLGTTNYDQAYFLQLGSDGGVYVLGQSRGQYPVTPGIYSNPNSGQFIHKLDANLGITQLSTVFGSGFGTPDISPTAFLVDRCDRIFVCGWGNTFGLPITPTAAQSTTDGEDFYLAQFAAGLTTLAYGTYYGSANPSSAYEHVDGGTSRFDPRGIVYQAVCSCFATTGFPVPPGANYYSTVSNSSQCNNAAFVFNFQPDIANAGTDQSVCATAGPVPLIGTPAGGVWTGTGVSGSVATGFFFTPSVALIGVQNLTYNVASTGACTTSGVRRMAVSAPPTVTFTPLAQTSFCLPATGLPPVPPVVLAAFPTGGTFSGPGVVGNTFTPGTAGVGTYTIAYTYTNGCTVTLTQTVRVLSANAGTNQTVCSSTTPIVLAGTPTGGTWSGPGVSGSLATGFVFTPLPALGGANTLTYTVTNPAVACAATSTRVITVTAVPAVAITPLPALCTTITTGQPLVATPAGGTWSGPGISGSSGSGYVFLPRIGAGTYQLTYTVFTGGTCPSQGSITVSVFNQLTAFVAADTVLCPGTTQPFALRGATPAGGVWSGPGVSGNTTSGFVFTPAANFSNATLTYTAGTAGGCTSVGSRRVSVAAAPPFIPSWTPVACPEDRQAPLQVQFNSPLASNGFPLAISWDFGDGLAATATGPVPHTYTRAGRYQPRATVRYNGNRCEISQLLPVIEVKEEQIPNIITPNGDSKNQFFRLPTTCLPRIQLFSRWGQRVFEAAAYQNNWDATGQPAGIYYYLLEYPDGHLVRGWVEVVKD